MYSEKVVFLGGVAGGSEACGGGSCISIRQQKLEHDLIQRRPARTEIIMEPIERTSVVGSADIVKSYIDN